MRKFYKYQMIGTNEYLKSECSPDEATEVVDVVTENIEQPSVSQQQQVATIETPMDLPQLNFAEQPKQQEETENEALDLPAMDFTPTHQENQQELQMHTVGESDDDEILDIPQW